MKSAHRKASRAKHQAKTHSWLDVIQGSREVDPVDATESLIRLRDAFEQLRTGSADCDLFDRVAASINVGMIRAEAIDPLAEAVMVRGRDALMSCDAIFGRHGRYGFHGPDLEPMAEAIDLYEQILRGSTPRQMHEALMTSMQRMREGQLIQAPVTTLPDHDRSHHAH